ncbi:MAG TPA: protein kinase [Polyangiaceae bacterium]|nr:protein kinase [Polyangiaceae bacterium]
MSDPHADPLIGALVAGRYRVIKPLGEGGMGQVYLAEHEAIEKKVALKVLKSEYSRKADIVTRFQQEAISASRIKHPNVLDVFDFGKLDTGEAFLAMEFLEGHDLSDDLAKKGVLDPLRGIHIALQICRALGAAHARGVVHRDMKPDNVFLQRTGDGEELVKIVDFGIAQLRGTNEEAAKSQPTRRRLTKTGMIFGTPEYMAPEQAAGRPADLRVDVYAVGVILYEMFTGAVPFTGDSFMAVLAKTLNDPPPGMTQMNPDLRIGQELQAVIMRALAKSPDQRYSSMSEFSNALLGTPEGAGFGRTTQASFGDARASAYPPAPGAATAGQFGTPQNAIGTLASPAQTAPGTTGPQGGTIGRTATPIGQSATVGPAQHGPGTGLVLGSLGLVAVLGVGGVFGYMHLRAQPAPTTDVAPPVPTATATAVPDPRPTPTIAAAAAAPAGSVGTTEVAPVTGATSNEVRLHIVTEPPGATVTKAGFQVCESTPCDFTANRNEGLDLVAQKGALRGSAKILPQHDQTVTIALAAPAPRPKPTERMCEVEISGIKVIRPCPK